MKEITFILLTNVLALSFISFSVLAGANASSFEELLIHTEAAMASSDGKDIVQHATEAINQARVVYDDKHDKVDITQMDQGLRFLDTAINEATKGEVGAATEAARKALEHFKQAR
jgi:hypothetical protein